MPVAQLVAGDNASLGVMHDTLVFSLLKGTVDSAGAVGRRTRSRSSARCPATTGTSPCASSSASTMDPVALSADGPDLDVDPGAGGRGPERPGIWVVPTYANPTGSVYTEEVTRELRLDAGRRPGLPDLLGQRVRRPPPHRRRAPRAGRAGPGRRGRQPQPGVRLRVHLEDHLRRRRGLVLRRLAGQRRLVPEAPRQAHHRPRQGQPPAARPVPGQRRRRARADAPAPGDHRAEVRAGGDDPRAAAGRPRRGDLDQARGRLLHQPRRARTAAPPGWSRWPRRPASR